MNDKSCFTPCESCQEKDKEIADLEENYGHVYRCAKEWMEKYDELKNKYEPMIAVTSEALAGGEDES